MEKYFLLFFLGLTTINSFSQTSAIPPALRASMTLNQMSEVGRVDNSNILYGVPRPPGKVIGDTYLTPNWQKGSILLYESGTVVKGYPLRYDINKNELEINSPNGIKVLAGDKIKSFSWLDSLSRSAVYFVNAKDLTNEEGSAASGFLEVIADGSLTVLKKTIIIVKKSDYVAQFDTGSRDDQIIKKEELYVVRGNSLLPVPSAKKKWNELFGDQTEKIRQYADENHLNMKEEHHVRAIFDYYNSLVKS